MEDTKQNEQPEVVTQKPQIPDEVMLKMKFYTAWLIFCQDSVSNQTIMLHCTHKYLGGQNNNSMAAVLRIIQKYMDKNMQGGWPRVNFNKRETFGGHCTCSGLVGLDGEHVLCETCQAGNGPVSVLTSADHKDAFWPFLRAELDQFREDDYPEYRPHITVDGYPEVTGHFQAYAIMNGDKPLWYWRNPHWDKIEQAAQRRAGMHAVASPPAEEVVEMSEQLKEDVAEIQKSVLTDSTQKT